MAEQQQGQNAQAAEIPSTKVKPTAVAEVLENIALDKLPDGQPTNSGTGR